MRFDRRWFNAIVYIVDTLARRLLISYLGAFDGEGGGGGPSEGVMWKIVRRNAEREGGGRGEWKAEASERGG